MSMRTSLRVLIVGAGTGGLCLAHGLKRAGIDVAVGVAPLEESTRGWIARAEGVVKLVKDRHARYLVGATSVGPSGGEVLSLLAAAVHARIPVSTLRGMPFAYPTFHRAVEAALEDLRR